MAIAAAVTIAAVALSSAAQNGRRAEGDARSEVRLWLGGDVNLGDGDAKNIFEPLAEMVKGAAGIVNLEGPVAAKAPTGPGLKLFNAPEVLRELKDAGVRVAEIANNHARDAGADAPEKTAEALGGAGLLAAGGPAGAAVLQEGGWRIVVAAYDLTGGVPKDFAESLGAAKKTGDVLLVSFHVTGPASYLPRPELRRAVEIARHSGARIITAHGTHVIGPVERRGETVIAWGLGNLAFACDCTKEREGLLLRVTIAADGSLRAAVIPIDAGLQGKAATLSRDPGGVFNLLAAIGSNNLERHGAEAKF